jgi:hypothetical protein
MARQASLRSRITKLGTGVSPSILATWEAELGRPVWANTLQDPISKLNRAKWTASVVQAVECLLH